MQEVKEKRMQLLVNQKIMNCAVTLLVLLRLLAKVEWFNY